jgi:8-oxo-dGTP diphosphatase
MLEVVCACIIHNNKVLIARRNEKQSNSLQWEFPGGKIEPNETPEEALKREIKEELGVSIQIQHLLTSYIYQYPTFQIHLQAYVATTHQAFEIELKEHIQYHWMDINTENNYTLCAADQIALSHLINNYSA